MEEAGLFLRLVFEGCSFGELTAARGADFQLKYRFADSCSEGAK